MKKLSLLLLLATVCFAGDYQSPQYLSGSNRGTVSLEDCTGASACWKFNELSGPVIDSVAAISVAQHNAANTYNISGSASYGIGVTMNPVAGGFSASGSNAAMEFGTGDGNVLVHERIDGALGAANFTENFMSTVVETGAPGWSFRLYNARAARFVLIASDTTTVTATWGNGTNDAIYNAYSDNLFHTWEIRINRAGATVELFLDNASFGTVSIAALAGLSITSSGIGIGNDYRAVDRDVPITMMFARVKKSLL